MPHASPVPFLCRPAPGLTLRLVLEVFKLRIGLAIGLATLLGLAVTPGSPLPAWRAAVLCLAVTMASAAAGAFNQLAERELDAKMRRTRNRAFVTGKLTPGPAWLGAIAALGALAIGLAGIAANLTSALYAFLGAFTYAVVYTIWLKRRTRWNIVVGGLAGSFAVLAGAAAVSPNLLEPLPLMFAAVLFLWTPPHFWSLAIAFHDDYAAAKVPMLPVIVGDERAARTIFACAALLVAASLVPAILGMGPIYLAVAVLVGLHFLRKSAQLTRSPDHDHAMANFRASLAYLTILIGAAIADSALRA